MNDPHPHREGGSGLPVPLTTFVGRARELDDVVRLARGTPLLTLTGAGGSGKTRLAIQAAARLAGEDGVAVVWVELAPVADPALLEATILGAAGIGERGARTPVDALAEAFGTRPHLLVLDNCEHLVERCAVISEMLLRRCPALRILATSREPLGPGAEVAWLVPPLGLYAEPGRDPLRHPTSDAERLFAERARAVVPAFEVTDANRSAVAEICRRLDGLPLAIELAAARLRVLAPGQIAERLNDSFQLLSSGSRTALPRHRTLQGVMDWSYDLLSPGERQLLARLSVFSGSFDLDAVEEVCGGGPLARDALLDLLSGLVEKSLVETSTREGTARYRLLETVRQYASRRLEESGEAAALRRAHARFYGRLATEAGRWLLSNRRPQWMARMAPELDNVHAAIAWTRAVDTELHLRLLGDLNFLWVCLGLSVEAREWVEDALRLPGAEAPTPGRASALSCAGFIAAQQGHFDVARPWLEEGARLWEALGHEREAGYALNYLGSILMMVDPRAGDRLMQRTRDAFHAMGDRFGEAFALNVGAVCLQGTGDLDAAIQAAGEAAALAREDGATGTLSIALLVLGAGLFHAGRPEEAARSLEEAAPHFRHDLHPAVARLLELYSAALARCGDTEAAAVALGAADAVRKRMGMAPADREPPPWNAVSAPMRARLGDPVLAAAWREGSGLDTVGALDWIVARTAPAPGGDEAGARTGATAAPGLRVRVLGPLQVYRGGEPVPPDAWGSAKPRELLLFLLTHPEGSTKEQVGLALWPDASPAQLRSSFHTTMHRLRRVLGDAVEIPFAGDRYRLEVPGGLELDADAFRQGVAAALRELRAGADAADGLREALELYRGGFLDGEPVGDWSLELRDRLERQAVEGLTALGAARMAAGRYPEALEALQRLVQIDVLNEIAYRRLMVCHARMGERGQALRLFQQLTLVLDEELGVRPEPETVALAERLKAGDEP